VKVIPSSVRLVRDPQQVDGHVPGHAEGWVTGTGSAAKRVGACSRWRTFTVSRQPAPAEGPAGPPDQYQPR